MTAGRSKCVTVSLSSWGSCLTAWKGSPQGCPGWLRFKGLQWKIMSDPHLPVGNTRTQNLVLAGGRSSNLAWEERKVQDTQSALSELSLGNLMFCSWRHMGKHVDHITVTCKKMGKGWEKGSTTDVVMLQNTWYKLVTWVLLCLYKGQRHWNLQGGHRGTSTCFQTTVPGEEIKRLGGPEASDSAFADIRHAWASSEWAGLTIYTAQDAKAKTRKKVQFITASLSLLFKGGRSLQV